MKVTQEKLPDSQIGLEIEIPPEATKKAYEKVVKQLSRTARIPGFRKGKVPRKILLQQLGPQRIRAAALEDLIQDSFKEAVENESIDALGNYQLRSPFEELIGKYQPGEPLIFSGSVDVSPEVKLGDYKGWQIKAEETIYDPQRVDEFLEERRVEAATLVPIEGRAAQEGDVAIVDYEGRFLPTEEGKEGEEISGAKAQDFELELEEGKFIKDIVAGILDMNPEETKEIAVTFPDDYPRDDLAGASANFTVTLKELKEKELPEIDDEFAEDISEFETLAELKTSLEEQYKEEAEEATKSSIEAALVTELLKQAEVDLPKTMLDKEVETMLTQTAMQMQQYGMDIKTMFTPENVAQMKERTRPEAIESLTRSLALLEIGKRESLQPEETEVEKRMQEVITELREQNVDKERLQEMVEEDLLRENTLKWLTEQSEVELVPEGSLEKEEEEIEEMQTEQQEDVEATTATVDVSAEEV